MKRMSAMLVVLCAGLVSGSVVAQVQVTTITKLTQVENGWFGEGLALHIEGPGIAGCQYPANQFAIASDHPSYRELTAMALSAFAASADVQIVVDTGVCAMARHRVVSIRMFK